MFGLGHCLVAMEKREMAKQYLQGTFDLVPAREARVVQQLQNPTRIDMANKNEIDDNVSK